jgi:hypothetical protein
MVSKITKSIASRIPLDLYFQLDKEAEEHGLNMKDYLLKIIEARHLKTEPAPIEKPIKVKQEISVKKTKPKTNNTDFGSSTILFPE